MKKAVSFLVLSIVAAAVLSAASPRIVLISGEYEYFSSNSLPAFKQLLETNYQFQCTYLQRTAGEEVPGLEALDRADLMILFMRRMTLPEEQLDRIKKFVAAGKSVIGIRTASHAFENWK